MTPLLKPKVEDITEYWNEPPPVLSERCIFWVTKIRTGWQRNYVLRKLDLEESSEFFGVYIWEYINILYPMLHIKDVISNKLGFKL